MEILIEGLEPGTEYIFQARSKSGSGKTSAWSTAFNHLTLSDITAPAPVTGLNIVAVGTSFIATWDKAEDDSNGKPLKDFRDYQIKLTAGATDVIYFVTQERFDFPLEANRNAFGSPEPTIDIEVRVRDRVGNLSTPVTDSASNAVPADVTNFVADGITGGVNLTWDASTEADFKYFELHVSTTGSGFTPNAGNRVYQGPGNAFLLASNSTIPHYFKVRAVDAFDQGSNYASASGTPESSTGVDLTPPDDPTAVTVTTTGATDGSSIINVDWTGVGSSNLSDYVVRYSLDEVAWLYLNVPAGQTAATITNLLPDTDYYVQVAAMSYANVKSDFVNADVYPITTAADTTAPSQPSEPTVSTTTLAAQVSHDMTKEAGGDLESDVEYLEVHASTSSGFTPSNSTLRGTLQSGGQGIDVSGVFYYAATDATANLYWKVIAVDRSKNKSTASNQSTGVPGLILNANIGNATITSAKINDLVANKITAGTGFVNDLTVNSTLTVGATGHVRSSDYNVGTETGWSLDTTGLTIFDGSIYASSLLLQDSNNVIGPAYASFEFNSEYYTSSILTGTATGFSINESTAKFGNQSLRLVNGAITNPTTHYIVYGDGDLSTTGLNVDVVPGDYIVSGYFKKNGSINQRVRWGLYCDSGAAVAPVAYFSVTSTSWTRYEVVLTIPSGVSKAKLYMIVGPEAANTGYDVLVDGLQIERKISALTTASQWKPPSQTAIDGGQIVTGQIRSNAPSSTDATKPAWSINTAGNMQVGDAEVRGTLVVGDASTVPGLNIVPDQFASFEQTPSYYTSPSNFGEAPLAGTTFTVEASGGAVGAQYFHAVNTGALVAGGGENVNFSPADTNSTSTNNIFLVPGQKYLISCYVKNLDPTKHGLFNMHLWSSASVFPAWSSDPDTYTAYTPDVFTLTSWTRIWGWATAASAGTGKVGFRIVAGPGTNGYNIGVDGIMIEPHVEGMTTPSTFEAGIVENSYIASANYLPGQFGWKIDATGSAEFNDTLIRGAFEVSSELGKIQINLENTRPTIKFYGDTSDTFAFINVVDDVPGEAALGINSGTFDSVEYPGTEIYHRFFMVNPAFVSILSYINKGTGDQLGGSFSWGETAAYVHVFDDTGTALTSMRMENTGDVLFENHINPSFLWIQPDGHIDLRNDTLAVNRHIIIGNKSSKVDLHADGYIILQGGDGTSRTGPQLIIGGTGPEDGYLHVLNEDWVNITVNSGTAASGNEPQVKLLPDGTCICRGSLANFVSGTILTLPVGYRPARAFRYLLAGDDGAGSASNFNWVMVTVATTGAISFTSRGNVATDTIWLTALQFSTV